MSNSALKRTIPTKYNKRKKRMSAGRSQERPDLLLLGVAR
jgi:hypothetical protein